MFTRLCIAFFLCFTFASSNAQCLLVDDKQSYISDNFGSVLSSASGCEQEEFVEQKPLYPNPTDGWIWSPNDGQVFNVHGRYLRTLKEGGNDVSELAQGVYIVIFKNRRLLRFVKV